MALLDPKWLERASQIDLTKLDIRPDDLGDDELQALDYNAWHSRQEEKRQQKIAVQQDSRFHDAQEQAERKKLEAEEAVEAGMRRMSANEWDDEIVTFGGMRVSRAREMAARRYINNHSEEFINSGLRQGIFKTREDGEAFISRNDRILEIQQYLRENGGARASRYNQKLSEEAETLKAQEPANITALTREALSKCNKNYNSTDDIGTSQFYGGPNEETARVNAKSPTLRDYDSLKAEFRLGNALNLSSNFQMASTTAGDTNSRKLSAPNVDMAESMVVTDTGLQSLGLGA